MSCKTDDGTIVYENFKVTHENYFSLETFRQSILKTYKYVKLEISMFLSLAKLFKFGEITHKI